MIKWPTHYYALDTETGGLDPSDSDITEIGIVEFKDGKIVNEYEELFKPNKPQSAKIIEITSITDDMLVNKEPSAQGIQKYLNILASNNLPIVAHNAKFDRSFINKYLPKNLELKYERWICSAALFKAYRAAHVLSHSNYNLPNKLEDLASWADHELSNYTYKTDKVLFNLTAAIAYLAIPRFNIKGLQHRAKTDAIFCGRVFEKLIEEFQRV